MENKNNIKEIHFLNLDFIGNLILIGCFIVGMSLNRDQVRKLNNEQTKYTKEEHYIIHLNNQIIVLIISTLILYTSYERYKEERSPTKKRRAEIQLISAILLLIGCIMQLYLAYVNYDSDIIV